MRKCSRCKKDKNKSAFYMQSGCNEKYVRMPCRKCYSEIFNIEKKEKPWVHLFYKIKSKCKTGYGKNIKCYFNSYDEIKALWFRDKAWLLKRPSIDRIDNNNHYCFDNCQFIERSENSRKDKKGKTWKEIRYNHKNEVRHT